MKTTTTQLPAIAGHKYAFALYRGGWYNKGLVTDDSRQFWANHWMSIKDESHGYAHMQNAARVAFMPFCSKGENFMSQAAIDCEAVEVIGNIETSRS
tara:strand:+ start:544 stop:834 length:291 start_codon:yes stop_codon:yes gene_type:complete